MELSNNIEANTDWVNVPSITRNSEIVLDDLLTFKIKDQAKPGSNISFGVELKSSGDDVDETYQENFTIRKRVHVNPDVQLRVMVKKNEMA